MVLPLWVVEDRPFPLLWPLAYTTSRDYYFVLLLLLLFLFIIVIAAAAAAVIYRGVVAFSHNRQSSSSSCCQSSACYFHFPPVSRLSHYQHQSHVSLIIYVKLEHCITSKFL